jgi:hypothetical protein
MASQDNRPNWWRLYLIFPLLIALFAVDHRLKLSASGHQMVQIGIILLVYGLVHLWLGANSAALSKMDQRQYHGTITIIRMPPSQLPDAGKDKRPMFQLPNSEIKGTLSDTFEMDYIDAESFPMDEVKQELKEEEK